MRIAGRIQGAADRVSASQRRGRECWLADLAARQHGVVAAWQLVSHGFSRTEIKQRLATARLHELHRGVYAVGHRAITREGRWLAAVLAAGPDAVLSHRDALALWGIAEFRYPEIEVTLPGLGSRRRPGLRIHRTRYLDPEDRMIENGIPVTSIARTLTDVAGSISPRHLRDAYLEAGRQEKLDVDAMVRVVKTAGRKRGIGRLRRLVAEDTTQLVETNSPLEVRFFDFCAEHGLPEPLPNQALHGFEVDAYWPRARLAVELDSWKFHRGRGAFESDRKKIGDLRLFGIEVIPVTDRRMRQEAAKLAKIIRVALDERS